MNINSSIGCEVSACKYNCDGKNCTCEDGACTCCENYCKK